MEFLKLLVAFLIFILISCTGTVTEIIQLETDTYITNQNNDNHAEATSLFVQNSGSVQSKTIVKLPTGENDLGDHIDDCLDDQICSAFFLPLALLIKLVTICEDAVLQPSNLTSAVLVLNTVDGSSPSAGSIQPYLLAKPWWQSANWDRAHPFSSHGIWTTAGGDINASIAFNANCVGVSCNAGEVKFEMTSYFQSLISSPNTTHYGFLLQASGALNQVELHSVQANSSLTPRLETTYTGSCLSTKPQTMTKTYYLGSPLK